MHTRWPLWLRWRSADAGVWAITGVLSLPLLSVLAALLHPPGAVWHHLVSTVLAEYVRNSLLLALGVVALGVCMGVTSAWLVTRYRFFGSRWLEWALVLPLAFPAYVVAYVYTDFLQVSGPLQTTLRDLTGWSVGGYWFPDARSLGGAVVVLAATLYPYVYLLARVAFMEEPRSLSDAGRLAGYSAWGRFFRITLPLARPAVAAGAALMVMETLADFGAVAYFGVPTFTTGIVRAWHSMGDLSAACRLASLLLLGVLVVLLLERLGRGRAAFHGTPDPEAAQAGMHVHGVRAAALWLAAALPFLLGCAIPLLLLLRLAFGGAASDDGLSSLRHLARLAGNSILLGALAALCTLIFAVILAYVARQSRSSWTALAKRIATLGYAIPGAVIAVGVMLPLAWADRVLAPFGVTLFLGGGLLSLVFAYLVRFLAVAAESVDAGLARITPSMDDAARSLGLSRWERLYRVHAPLLSRSLASGLLLVFVDVMKELPATFILRPFNLETLAVRVYNLASDERLDEAARASLAIVAVGLLPVILVARRMRRR
jgi:iron(III) transport system permease protein